MSEDYIKIRLPKNPLVILTIILGILLALAVIFIVISVFGINLFTGMNADQVGQRAVNFINTQTNSTVQLENVTQLSGIYQIDVSYQGQTIPIYSTKDGKYLIQSIIPVQ